MSALATFQAFNVLVRLLIFGTFVFEFIFFDRDEFIEIERETTRLREEDLGWIGHTPLLHQAEVAGEVVFAVALFELLEPLVVHLFATCEEYDV